MKPRADASSDRPTSSGARIALTLGGGAARGLAHIGVLDVFEREGIKPDCIVGSSMGALLGGLSASGLRARDIAEVARGFCFPRWFIPGGMLRWEVIFASAVPQLSRITFEKLATPLLISATDLEAGSQVVLRTGPVLPAIRATCAVPGVLAPVKLDGRWLVDGGLVNVLPVDVAWMMEPQVVVAVKVGAARNRPMPRLNWWLTSFLSLVGNLVPNPGTAKIGFEVLVRAAEITLDRQTALAAAMTNPEMLIEPDLGDIGLRDFDRCEDAIRAGRRAAEKALPELLRLLTNPPRRTGRPNINLELDFDVVCSMVISKGRSRASTRHAGETYYFCSANCLDCFKSNPDRYLKGSPQPHTVR